MVWIGDLVFSVLERRWVVPQGALPGLAGFGRDPTSQCIVSLAVTMLRPFTWHTELSHCGHCAGCQVDKDDKVSLLL